MLEVPNETPEIAALGFEPNMSACVDALATALGIDFTASEWTLDEISLGDSIAAEKYATEAFLHKR